MCDYSLENKLSRPAVVGEKLITHHFGGATDVGGTTGFKSADDRGTGSDITAVCLLPGTELAFDANVRVRRHRSYDRTSYGVEVPEFTIPHAVARFCKINPDELFRHHDGLEFPDRLGVEPVVLNLLVEGQTATVLQMPAEIKIEPQAPESTKDRELVRTGGEAPSFGPVR